jgi:hypothetical protein
MSEFVGPMGLANQEIRGAADSFAAARLGSRRLPVLLERTDAILAELETLNLMEVRRTPAPLRSAISALIADLPLDYTARIGPRPSPTAAIEMVFDVQARIFNVMYGCSEPSDPTQPADHLTRSADQLIEVAS